MHHKEINKKDDLKEGCMREVSNRSRMSETTPPMTYPLVDKLQYHGMIEYSDQVILGTALEV
eukprot:6880895-Ditylum_brightwellii.AAC.1